MWPDRRLLDLFGIEIPIAQAPMAAATGVEMAVAVAKAGGSARSLAPCSRPTLSRGT
jgi:NAD(P)H-dependent flavin oxidoreductase YrpB (nitropropane dioxygenase family)